MDEVDAVDEPGPVDWIVVEFPGSKFNGRIAPALHDLVERDQVRVLDLLVLKKDDDGSLEAFELSDLDEGEIGELRTYESELAMLLSEEDVTSLAPSHTTYGPAGSGQAQTSGPDRYHRRYRRGGCARRPPPRRPARREARRPRRPARRPQGLSPLIRPGAMRRAAVWLRSRRVAVAGPN